MCNRALKLCMPLGHFCKHYATTSLKSLGNIGEDMFCSYCFAVEIRHKINRLTKKSLMIKFQIACIVQKKIHILVICN